VPLKSGLTGAFVTRHVLLHLRGGAVFLNHVSLCGATARKGLLLHSCHVKIQVFWGLRASLVPQATLLLPPGQAVLILEVFLESLKWWHVVEFAHNCFSLHLNSQLLVGSGL